MRLPTLYEIGFAIVNFAEAIFILATLGIVAPGWTMHYATWAFKREVVQH